MKNLRDYTPGELINAIDNTDAWDKVLDELAELSYRVEMVKEWADAGADDAEDLIYAMLEKLRG